MIDHLELIKSILEDHGFIAAVTTNCVVVELLNRPVTTQEVFNVLFDEELDNLCQVSSDYRGIVKVFPLD